MQTLSRHSRSEISCLLKRNYESVYSRLLEVLTPEEVSLFASVQSLKREMIWDTNDGIRYRSYSAISEEDKDEVSDILQDYKERILPKLQQDRELGNIASQLLLVPSENDIYIGKKADGSLTVKLAKWGCKKARGETNNDPLYIIVNRPKSNHFPAQVCIRYSDGSPYAQMPFVFTYKERIKSFNTNQDGDYPLGLLKKDVGFSIQQSETTPETIHHFTMSGKQQVYEAVFPYYISFNIEVVDQKGVSVPNIALNIDYENFHRQEVSNNEGRIPVTDLELTTAQLILTEVENPDNQQAFSLNKETNTIVFKIYKQYFGNIIVKVINENNEPVDDYPLSIDLGNKQLDTQTNATGVVDLGRLEVGQQVVVNSENQSKTFEVEEGENEFILRITTPSPLPPEMVTVKLINHKNEPLPNIPMNFNIGEQTYQAVTGENGLCQFEKTTFTDKEKVEVQITAKKKNDKDKIYHKTFTFDNNQLEYVIKLKKRRWLWLLLLLLPLLLLIQCEKDVTIETLESSTKNPIPNTEVNLSYTKYALFDFDTKKFFTADKKKYQDITGTDGRVTFSELSYTWYSAVFKRNTVAQISAYNKCHSTDSLNVKFHRLKTDKTVTLYLTASSVDLDFLVVDKEDNEPLPQANVVIETEFDGIKIIDIVKTAADGRVLFKQVPKCGKIKVLGELKGYFPDSIINRTVEELSKGKVDGTRKLELVPIKEKIVFFVTNCKTGEPLPDAIATIHLKNQDNPKMKKAYTNVNGIGKGEYDDAHIISKLRIDVRKKFFKDGVWDKGLSVEEFIALPDSARVICLEPEENPLTFQNIDAQSQQPLSGVKNSITIDKGNTTDTLTEISNTNGLFVVSGLTAGNKITIHSYFDPCYEPSTTTIVNADVTDLLQAPASDRIIPLEPKVFTLTFQTFDSDVDTLVNDANLQVIVDGQVMTPTNSGNGKFEVQGYCNSTISIVAEKVDYQKNDTKVRNQSFDYLRTSPQTERNIPLRMKPCDQSTNGNTSGQEYYIDEFNMKTLSGEFIFEYFTDSEPDEIIVYCGRKNEIGPHNQLFQYFDATMSNTYQERIRFSGCSIITVVVKGGSHWKYTVNCP